jgi:hypothetical protein
MIAQVGSPVLITRRHFAALSLTVFAHATKREDGRALVSEVVRTPVAMVERRDGLAPPVTLGMAKIVLRVGAAAWAETPDGARMIVVESGVLGVSLSTGKRRFTSGEFEAADGPVPFADDELLVPAGTVATFGALAVASVRNPGARPVVALDVAVYPEEPRPIPRSFTTDDGVSFQLLASANAATVPAGPVVVTLERLRLGARASLPHDVSRGLTLAYLESGTLALRAVAGEVFAARPAASAPYAMPGSLLPIGMDRDREVTAGAVIFLPVGGAATIANASERRADLLTLGVREAP